MSIYGLIVIFIIYVYCAFDFFKKGDVAQGVAFCGWALGQVGLILTIFYRTQ